MNVWALFSLAAVLLTICTAATLFRHLPPRRLLPALPAALGAAFLFSFGDLLAQLSEGTPALWAGVSLSYTGLVLLGPLWFWLAVELADYHGLRPRWLQSPRWKQIPLCVGALSVAFVHTNPWHGQFLTLAEGRNDYHVLWYIQALNGYLTSMGALGVYAWMARSSTSERVRRQVRPMTIAATLTPILNAIYVLSPMEFPFDLTTVGVATSCAILVLALRREEFVSVSVESLGGLLEWDSDAVLLVDDEGRLVQSNPAAQRLFGHMLTGSGIDVLDRLCHVLRRPGAVTRPLSPDSLRRRLLGSSQADGQLFRLADRWIRLESTLIKDSDGRTHGAFLRARDETALRAATEAAAEHAAALEATFAATGEGICISDVRNRVLFANDRYGEILGLRSLRPGVDLNALLEELLPRLEDSERFVSIVPAIVDNPAIVIQDTFAMADGRIIERTSVPLMQDDRVSGRVWRLADVTEERRSEEAIRNAQKLESLGLMAGGVAHDFNNLLVSVLGNADLALLDIEPESGLRPLLEDIRRAAERGSDLTTALLAFSGRSSGALELIDLSEVAREMIDLVRVSLGPNVRPHFDLPSGLPAVSGEATQLRQVVMNLLINGADAMQPHGGPLRIEAGTVTMSVKSLRDLHFPADAEPGNFTFLRVTDEGIGMDEETRQRIFDPFFTTKENGRGLGLAATLGVVKGHRGALDVTSTPGSGSTFTVYLPAHDERLLTQSVDEEDEIDHWRGTGRILLADDEPAVRRVAVRILSRAGFEVVEVENGAEAIDLFKEMHGDFRMVVLDLTMPVMGGKDALRRLRELDPKVPVLLASGFSSDQVALDEFGGRTDFLAKPYRSDALSEAIRRLLGE